MPDPISRRFAAGLAVAALLVVAACAGGTPNLAGGSLPNERWQPAGSLARATVILAHDCEGATIERDELRLWAALLSERGYQVVLLKDFLINNCGYPEAPGPGHRAERLVTLARSLAAETPERAMPFYALGFGHGGNAVMAALERAQALTKGVAVYPDCRRADSGAGSSAAASTDRGLLILAVGRGDNAAQCVGLAEGAAVHVYPDATVKFDSQRVSNRDGHRYDPVAHQDALHRITAFFENPA